MFSEQALLARKSSRQNVKKKTCLDVVFFYTTSNEWDERNARTLSVLHAVAIKIFRTLYIYIYIFLLRIHRHSKSRDEVRAQSRKTPAHVHIRGHYNSPLYERFSSLGSRLMLLVI